MALQDLRTYFNSTNRNEFMSLLKQRCLVTEKIQASSFHVRKTDKEYDYYKSGSKTPMNKVDRTIVKYYENAIDYFKSISNESRKDMPTNWKFGFDYMTDVKTIDIKYDLLPKNNLILTHIQVLNPADQSQIKKVIRDPKILEKWANILEVQSPPIIFDGVLDSNQKDQLVELLEMNDQAFENAFKSNSFTRKVYTIFNNMLNKSALNESLDGDIDSLILSFIDKKNIKNFKLGRFDKAEETNRESSDMYQIAILDLVEYLTQVNLDKIELVEEETDLRYIELISEIFNKYINKNAVKYVGAEFDSASFSSKPGFELNRDFIKNENTIKIIQNKDLSELYKIMLGSFRKKRIKETKIINQDLMLQMNSIVKRIEATVFAKKNESEIMTFNTYLKQEKLNTQISPITEALTVEYPNQGKMPVNMFVGRFQPFTLGHAKVIETIHKQNGHPIVIFLVKSKNKKKEDAFKRPYSEELQIEMLQNLKKKYPIQEVFVVPTAAIDKMFNMMRPKYEPVLWGTGSDRMKVYGYQVDKQEYRDDLGVREDFGLFEIPRTGKNISATQVRNAMLDDDEKLFKKLTPKEIHSMYPVLKNTLEQSMSTVESVSDLMTFSQFLKS